MKRLSLSLFFCLFFSSLLTGYFQVRSWTSSQFQENARMSIQPEQVPTLSNGQRSFLLITSDVLDTEHPELKSIWLASYRPPSSHITLLPVFPSVQGSSGISSLADSSLQKAFGLQSWEYKIIPTPEFLTQLKVRGFEWSGYILMDLAAWKTFLNNFSADPDSLVNRMAHGKNGNNPQQSDQAPLLQQACLGISGLTNEIQMRLIASMQSQDASTSMFGYAIFTDIQNLVSSGGNLTCDFPTLFMQGSK